MTSLPQALELAWKYFQAGQLQQAEEVYLQILQTNPNEVNALHLLGLIAGQTGRYDMAVDYLQATLRLKPDYAAAHNNLGNVFIRQGKQAEAVASFRQAALSKPDFAAAHCNLGNALREQGHLDEAVASLREALRLRPDDAEAHNNLALALQAQGKLDDALASCCQALSLKPDFAEACQNLGEILKDQGRLDDALAAYRSALRIQPDAAYIHSNLVLALHYHPGYDARSIREEGARWNQLHAEPLKRFIRPHANRPDPERRLRIGYVSPDFRDHVDAFFLIPLLSNHDHRQFEIICYANVPQPDAVTERLRGYADVWRSTLGLSDEALADLVRSDQIDILVDLEMHVANNRLLMFARKPAPVQVAWLGYPGTTGLSTMDYRLTDPYLDPPGLFDSYYAEESVRLPDTFWCYDPLTDQPPVNELPALENGVITFGCLNNFCKINDSCLALWGDVLQAVPQSRFLLRAPAGETRDHVLARLQRKGIEAARIEFVDRVPRQEYLKLYHRIDLGLDPLPYNGHTTSLDAFWMGVPVLTLVGKTVVGRAGWSQLCNLGLQELAAETPEQFVALSARLAADLPRLQNLRATLRQGMQQSPLMDGKRFACNMEQAYRQMWRRWCQQEKPQQVSKAIASDQPTAGPNDTARISLPPTFDMAWKHFQAGQLQEAEQLFRQILQVDPNQVDALNLLGLIAGQTGRHDLAVGYLNATVRLKPDSAPAHNNLGNALTRQGKSAEAVASYRRALSLKPDYVEAHCNLGAALQAQGHWDEAIACYREALRLRPEYAEAHSNLGLAYRELGRLDEALACYDAALRLNPGNAGDHNDRGNVLHQLGRPHEAEASYREALRLCPHYADAHHNLGAARVAQGRPEEAVACYEQALRLRPQHAETRSNLGLAYLALGRLDEALACCDAAIRLNTDYAGAHNNRGIVLHEQGRLDEAEASYREARRLRPADADAHSNLGRTLQAQGRLDEAIACYREALRLRPQHADAHLNRATAWLLIGNFEQGWPEFEWRWKSRNDIPPRNFLQPLWDDSPQNGRTILLHAEQGFGDTFQFIRYAPLVKQRGGTIIVECQAALVRLLARCPGIDRLVAAGSSLPDFDVHAPLLSLPGLLGTTLATVPAAIPYLFADEQLVEHWRCQLKTFQSFKVGIFWQGNTKYREDKWRSIPLSEFAPLARLEGVQLFSLQKGPGTEQLHRLADRFSVVDLGPKLDEASGAFMDTAAVMKNLDLVITSDSSVAHLAGALGVPVWVALPVMPDWRWLLDREDSPWYPTMRLFRQTQRGNWDDVFQRLAAALQQVLATGFSC
jgi:predicted O-linked N-acetylglucosamine transferase (SPINDLY family)